MNEFQKATLGELSRIDRLVYTRQLTDIDLIDMERWTDGRYGWAHVSSRTMIDWLEGKPMREDLPSGVLFP